MDDYVFDKSIFCLFSKVSSVMLRSLSRNWFIIIKSVFFSSISKSVVTYVTLTVTNISNNIKQYCGIMKKLKVS